MTTIAKLDHIGIAVGNLPRLKELFLILGMQVERSEPVPEQGVVAHFLPISSKKIGSRFEFLETTDPEGVVSKFIKKRGPGVHHLAFTLEKGELDPLCARLRKAGYQLIYDSQRLGAHGMRINFIHPGSAEGVLIEIMEPAD